MNPKLHVPVWVLFAAVVYLIAVEAVRPWIDLPGLGNIGFTLVFVGFSVLHCAACEGWRRTGLFFATAAVVSYLLEEIGVRTGLVYGPYHYSDMLGPKLGHVPVLIPLAWFMMIYPSWMVARAMLAGIDTRTVMGIGSLAAVAAFVMTGWDMVMDPGMAAAGNWTWEKGGAYFGVPRHNYVGWVATTFLVYCVAGWLWRKGERVAGHSRWFMELPVVVYAFFAFRYVTENRIPALQLVAVFSMGVPALVAGVRVLLGPGEQTTAGDL